MPPRFNQTVTIANEVLSQEVNRETLILDLNSESYFGLDEVGTRIWHLLQEHGDVQEVFDVVLEEFDVDADTLVLDMKNLLDDLMDKGLIKEVIRTAK